MPALGMGFAIEMDRDEAYAGFDRTTVIWSVAAMTLAIIVLLLVALFSITERRLRRTRDELVRLNARLEDQVRSRTAELEKSHQRLEIELQARTDLLAAVSHELRTPLTSVLGFSHLLRDERERIDPSLHVFVDMIQQEGEELADLVEDLLTSTRLATGDLALHATAMWLDTEVTTTVNTWQAARGARVALDAAPVAVTGDALRLRQILRNLLSNAERHGGPHIEVTTGSHGTDGWLVVSDDGPPIEHHVRRDMFDMYSRKPGPAGLAPSIGVGLTVSRQLARAMGGDIVFGRSDEMNRFTVTLPLHEIAADQLVA